MPDVRKIFGDSAEGLAAKFLQKKGLRILGRQYRTKLGEIDLIAKDGDEIVFVEVKARKSAAFGYPEESVTPAKLRKIANTAEMYMREKNFTGRPYRVDVIAIEFHFDPPRITHIEAVG